MEIAETKKLNIVNIIKNNTINCIVNTDNNKLIEKINKNFTNDEQHIFIANFYGYLNYSKTDFIINLDDIYKWIGFSRKSDCKKILVKNFIENTDYIINKKVDTIKISAAIAAEIEPKEHGNKELIMLTINTFKKLCLKADTKKANDIHDYYIKLEEILQEVITEESIELRNQLLLKDTELLLKENEIKETKKELEKLIEESKSMFFYIFKSSEYKTKPGLTNNLDRTLNIYRRNSTNTCFEWTYEFKDAENARMCESIIKMLLTRYREKHHENTEIFNLDVSIVKDIAMVIINIFDNTDLTHEEQLKTFLKHFKEEKKEIKEIIQEEIKKIVPVIEQKEIKKDTLDDIIIIKEIINKFYEKTNQNTIDAKTFYDTIYNDLKINNRELQEKLQYTTPKNGKTGCMGYKKLFIDTLRESAKSLGIKLFEAKVVGEKSGFYLKLRENM